MKMKWRNCGAVAFLLFGLTQMAGELSGSRLLRGLGAASVVTPLPKVFCDIRGIEPFASSFAVTIDDNGEIPITPATYGRLKGPDNRRNVYGAAIAGAPLLPDTMRQTVLAYAFAPDGPLGRELDVTGESTVTLTVRNHSRAGDKTWKFRCRP